MSGELTDLREHLQRYRAVTLQVLDLVADDQLAWRPGPGHYTLGQQLLHIAQAEDLHARGLFEGDWDLERARFPRRPLTRAYLRDVFARVREYTLRQLDAVSAERLGTVVSPPGAPIEMTLRSGLWFILEHELHHKGQVWLYLRLMGIVPPFYAMPLPAGERPDVRAREELGGFEDA